MPDLPPRARALLWSESTLVLATEREGQPWVASAFYAPEERDGTLTLTCAFLATSRKLTNLRANPHTAAYIGPREPTRWLQLTATAEILDEPSASESAIARLVAHAPGARVFVDRVPVTPVLLRVHDLKLTDLTGERPPVESWHPAP
jgi:nitroimidazol reductase NimA-like FMN-containing flavoprotein (pyridoxamine 5'-phosphate oxidase superfamily)